MTTPPLGFWPDSKKWLAITNPDSGLEDIFASLDGNNVYTGNQYITGDLRATTLEALGTVTASKGGQNCTIIPDDINHRLWLDVGGTAHSGDSILLGDAVQPDNPVLSLGGISIGTLTAPASQLDVTQSSNITPAALFIGTANTTTIGPYISIRRNKGVAALANDFIGGIYFDGNNSTVGAINSYALIRTQIITPTAGAENGQLQFATEQAGSLSQRMYIGLGAVLGTPTGGDKGLGTLNATAVYVNGTLLTSTATGSSGHFVPYLDVANTWSAAQTITITNAGTALTLISTDAGTASGPYMTLHRDSASPAPGDALGEFRINGNDNLGNTTPYGGMRSVLNIATDGSEESRLELLSTQLGSYGARISIGQGLYTYTASGGDMGTNTINASALYEAGVAISTKYARLGVANTWTQPQIITGTLTLRSSTQDCTFTPDAANNRLAIDVGGSGHSADSILLGGSTGTNPVLIPGNAAIGAMTAPGSRLDVTQSTTSIPNAILINTANSAGTSPQLVLDRNKGGTNIGGLAADNIGIIRFRGRSSTGVIRDYATIYTNIVTATNALEDGRLIFQTLMNGAPTTAGYFSLGLVVGGPTGGDKGGSTINTTTLYEAGISLAAKYAALTGATFTGSVTAVNLITTSGYIHVDRGLDAATAVMYISASNGWGGQVQYRTGASVRWVLYKNTTAESGTATGSDFQILRYDNDGAPLGSVLTITRSTGSATFAGGVTATGALTATAGGLYVDRRGDTAGAYMYMYADVNQFTQLTMYSGNTARWAFFKNITPETGGTTGNGGADFELRAYNNDGSSHGTPLSINRASCIVNFASGIAVQGPGINVSAGNITNTGGVIDLDRRSDGVSAIMHIRSPSASASYIYFDGGDGTLRWLIGKNTAAETGDSVTGTGGANFVVYAYDNNGGTARNALAIYRDSLETHFAGKAFAASPALGDDSSGLATTAWVKNETHTINPITYGAVGNGTTNDQDALQRCINDCPIGGTVDGLNKKYKVNKTTSSSVYPLVLKGYMTLQNIEIDASGIGANGGLTNDGVLFTTTGGSEGSNKYIHDVVSASDTITMDVSSDVSAFTVGDWVIVESDDIWDESDGCFMAELHQVKSKTSTAITFYGSIKYSMPSNPRMRKITTVNELKLINVKAYGNNTPIPYDPDLPPDINDNPLQGQWGAHLKYCKDLIIRDCDFQKFADRCFAFYMNINTSLTENTIGLTLDDYGYGIQIQAASYSTRVQNNRFVHCKHGIDFGDDEGPTRNTIISGNTFSQMRSGGIDAHAASDDTLIDGNIIEDNADDPSGSAAIYYKGANVSITNNRITGPPNDGILVADKTTCANRCKVLINGNTIWDVRGSHCIYVMREGPLLDLTQTTVPSMESIIITNNDVRHNSGSSGSYGMRIRANNGALEEVVIVGNRVRGPMSGIYLETYTMPAGMPPVYISSAVINSNNIRTVSGGSYGIRANGATGSPISTIATIGNVIINGPTYGIRMVGVTSFIATSNSVRGCENYVVHNASNFIVTANLQ